MTSKRSPGEPLPPAIGRPALRALTAAGITCLEEVRHVSDRQLAGLHGVGPKAIGILRAALNARPSGGGVTPRRRSHGNAR
jgi:hypothetical protein